MRSIIVAYSIQFLEKTLPQTDENLRLYILKKYQSISGSKQEIKKRKNLFTKQLKLKEHKLNEEYVDNIFQKAVQQGSLERVISKEVDKIDPEKVKSIIQFPNNNVSSEKEIIERIKKSTQELDQRNWIVKIINSGSLASDKFSEDLPSAIRCFKIFNNNKDMLKPISEYNSIPELFKAVKLYESGVNVEIPTEEQGVRLLDSQSIDGYDVDLYYLTRVENVQEVNGEWLDSIQIMGQGTSWCVSLPSPVTNYEPDEFHCFYINGNPEVLVHSNSNQIKDTNDGTLNNYFVRIINPLVEEYDLNQRHGDWYDYNEALEISEEIRELLDSNNEKGIIDKLSDDPDGIGLFPIEESRRFIPVVYKKIDKLDFSITPNKILNILGEYIYHNNLDRRLIDLYALEVALEDEDRYLKLVPESFRSTEVNKVWNKKKT